MYRCAGPKTVATQVAILSIIIMYSILFLLTIFIAGHNLAKLSIKNYGFR